MVRGQQGQVAGRGAIVDKLMILDPKGTTAWIEGMEKLDARRLRQQRQKASMVGSFAMQVLDAPEEQQPLLYAQGRAALLQQGVNTQSLPETFSQQGLHMVLSRALGIDKYGEYLEDQKLKGSDLVKIAGPDRPQFMRAEDAIGKTPLTSGMSMEFGPEGRLKSFRTGGRRGRGP